MVIRSPVRRQMLIAPRDDEQPLRTIDINDGLDLSRWNKKMLVQIYKVRQSGIPNSQGCKFTVDTTWNLEKMENLLEDYNDMEVIDYLWYEFPVNAVGTVKSDEVPSNQRGAHENIIAFRKYLKEEIKHRSIIRPFSWNPFGKDVRFSLLDTQPKQDSEELKNYRAAQTPSADDLV